MRTLTFIYIFLLFFQSLTYSQSIGQVVHPAPFFIDYLGDIIFCDSQTGYVITSGNRILKSTNSGDNWSEVFSTTQFALNRINFVNKDTGIVTITKDNFILRTTNGGNNWHETWIGSYYYRYKGICFINNKTGYIVGGGEDAMDARKTTTYGNSWTYFLRIPGFFYTFEDVYFKDSLNGFIVGSWKFLRTTNGGTNWYQFPFDRYFYRIVFENQNIGYASYNGSGIYVTLNGGIDWVQKMIPGAYGKATVHSTSEIDLYAGDERFNIFKSNNQGNSWSLKSSSNNSGFGSFAFLNVNTGYAVGGNGYVLKTTNRGNNWFKNVDQYRLNSVKVKSTSSIVSAGEDGIIFLSRDLGNNWEKLENNFHFEINSINTDTTGKFFIGVGDSSNIIKSDSSGLLWEVNNLNNKKDFYKIATLGNHIFILGDNSLYYSDDNSSSWNNIFPKNYSQIDFRGVSAINNVFYIAGDSGTVLKSNDLGTNWIEMNFPKSFPLNEIYFLNDKTGYVVGDNPYDVKVYIYKTTNSGSTWDSLKVSDGSPGFNFNKIVFPNESTGYVFSKTYSYKTTNSGLTWGYKAFPSIMDYDFINKDTVFMVGGYGEIYRTINATAWNFAPVSIVKIQNLSTELPKNFLLLNYPNPFNPGTKIRLSVPRPGHIKVRIFNISGEEIVTLINENLLEGTYEINFSADDYSLSSGIYFIQLETLNYRKSSKMILLR